MRIAHVQIHPTLQRIDYRFVLRSVGDIVWRGCTFSLALCSIVALLLLVRPAVLALLPSDYGVLLAWFRRDFAQLGIADDASLLVLALCPSITSVAQTLFSSFFATDQPLTVAQLAPMRACMAAGWLVDFDGDQYALYGPQGERLTLDHLVDLEDFVIDLEDTRCAR